MQRETQHVPEPRVGRSVSLDQAAVLLGVSRRTIYNRIRQGRLRTIRTLGGSQRVLLDSVRPDGTMRTDEPTPNRQGGGFEKHSGELEERMLIKSQIRAGADDEESIVWSA